MKTWIRRARSGTLSAGIAVVIATAGLAPGVWADTTPAPGSPGHSLGSSIPGTASDHTQNTQNTQSSAAQPASQTFVPGMDVSGYQGTVDWSGAKSDGARFVYIKATEDTNLTSSKFTSQWAGATAQDFIRGAYHFAIPSADVNGAAAQANFFVTTIASVNAGNAWTADGKTLPPMVDLEGVTDPTQPDYCYNINPTQMVSWIATFSNTVFNRTGIRPVIYTTTFWWKNCTGNSAAFSANPLFIANWDDLSSGPGTLPASWSTYTFWQHASDGTFPGDQDVFNGTTAGLTAFAAHATPDSNYITALYQDYLGRRPAGVESAGWETLLANGAPRSSIAGGFVNSDEYRLIRIDSAYQSVLGRPAEQAGRLNWLSAMRSGGITTDDIETALYASTEYYQQHGNTDTGFVTSLYNTLLHRQGTSSDYAFWAELIRQHGRAWVIAQYWDAEETISERVSAMYELYLGRVPDSAGLQGWVNVALQIGDTGLRSGFTSSDEYYSRSQNRTF